MRNSQRILTIILTVALAGLLVWVSGKYTYNADWTAGNRNSLTPPSEQVLDALPDEIQFTAYAYPGPERESIRVQIDRYQRYRDDIRLEFVDPGKNPQRMRELNITRENTVRVTYQGRSETLEGELGEQTITNALQRLSASSEQWLVFLSGHRERDAQDEQGPGYASLRAELERQGFKVRGLNLVESPRVPDNTAVLVIASPQNNLLPGEVQLIEDYVERGGNLLWLDDPGPRLGLQPLADRLGLEWLPGTIIYPDFRELGTGHPAIALVVNYPRHPLTRRMDSLTLFPFAGGLRVVPGENPWQAAPILKTPPRSWLETGSLEDQEVVFSEEDGDQVGPIDLGIALQRPAPPPEDGQKSEQEGDRQSDNPGQQRAVVVADSDFLANTHINNLGNLQLGVSLFQWLANRDAQISVQVPPAPDSTLQLAPWQGRFIWWGFVLFLPLALLGIGVGRWWLRRRR